MSEHESPRQDVRELEERQLALQVYKNVIDVQMHFNDILMRVRNMATTLIIAVYGAAAISIERNIFLGLCGRQVHIAFFIVLFGLAGVISFAVLDWGYYHRLLLGAVKKAEEIEAAHEDDNLFGMTKHITEQSRVVEILGHRFEIKARNKILFFYGVFFVIGAAFAWLVFSNVVPANFAPEPSTNTVLRT